MVKNKPITGFCYKRAEKILFIDLFSEKTTEYKLEQFENFINEYDIDETFFILCNKEGSFVTPLFKSSATPYLQKYQKSFVFQVEKEQLISSIYEICISMQKKKKEN
jgi:hypothetical protein